MKQESNIKFIIDRIKNSNNTAHAHNQYWENLHAHPIFTVLWDHFHLIQLKKSNSPVGSQLPREEDVGAGHGTISQQEAKNDIQRQQGGRIFSR